MAVLVSGNPGAGKSTLTAELLHRGVRAVDADEVEGLAAWTGQDGEVVGDASLPVTPELLARCSWAWSPTAVTRLAADLGRDGVLLGIAVNQWDVLDAFDTLVLLELDEETQRARVATRDPLVQQQVLAGRAGLQRRMLERGAVSLDASRPTAAVADDLLALLRRPGPRSRVEA
ncbi:hypothetical protein [Desertihabitans aurantiacus]|uniref:hypothetical protein n=1 Tax=Desertihabitans aurantiacus TaxID=2282477 RepID=UPI000DF78948|nr:hypothetical protein [Desertihabitans aurantiacus]